MRSCPTHQDLEFGQGSTDGRLGTRRLLVIGPAAPGCGCRSLPLTGLADGLEVQPLQTQAEEVPPQEGPSPRVPLHGLSRLGRVLPVPLLRRPLASGQQSVSRVVRRRGRRRLARAALRHVLPEFVQPDDVAHEQIAAVRLAAGPGVVEDDLHQVPALEATALVGQQFAEGLQAAVAGLQASHPRFPAAATGEVAAEEPAVFGVCDGAHDGQAPRLSPQGPPRPGPLLWTSLSSHVASQC